MTAPFKRNLPASVRERLLALAAQRHEAFDLVLIRFAIERLLYRLSRSPYADRFLLKGAMLFVVQEIRTFIGPVLAAVANRTEWSRHKKAGTDWT